MRGRWVLATAVVLALSAVGFFVIRHSLAAHAKAVPAPLPDVPAPSEITLTGTIEAAQVVNVPVPVDGTVEQFMADAGKHVSEGEVLARIRNPRLIATQQAAKLDAEQAQNRLSQLESALIAARLEVSRSEADAIRVKSALEQAEKTFERQETMFREGVTPRLAYEKAEHEYNSLKAEAQNLAETAKKAADRVDSTTNELEPARKVLAQKTSELEDAEAETAVGEINSPADGVVIRRRGQMGQPVTRAMSDMFEIAVDPQVLQVVAALQPQAALRIQPGQTAGIQIAGAPSPMTGIVRVVKSGQIFIDITNPPPAITRGMTVRIKIKLP
jgi:multidrug resistance efflux pump